jgi:hypothetical protein
MSLFPRQYILVKRGNVEVRTRMSLNPLSISSQRASVVSYG